MERKLISIGTAAVLATGAALAATPAAAEPAIPAASSYADLLQPVANASARLKLADAEYAVAPARLEEGQYYAQRHHHHHHHHDRRWYLSNGYIWSHGRWILRPRHHHHHHHNHDHH